MKVYLDNAATTFPKPPQVYSSILDYMTNIGANPGRGGYSNAIEGNRIVINCREVLMNFFNFDLLENVIFTSNITMSLNILIKSIVKEGWHVITSSMEHNSVLRPLSTLEKGKKIELTIVPCSIEGIIDIEVVKNSIKGNTKLIVLSHASNVIGSIQPLAEIGCLCKDKGIYFIIDSAQTAGVVPVDFKKLNCNALAFTGHKSLLGPQGIGGFLIDNKLNEEATTYFEGGTGSLSESVFQPDFLPDKFETGTLNTPAIAGLLSGVTFINNEGLQNIKQKEDELYKLFLNGILNMDDVTVYGLKDPDKSCAVVSLNSNKINNAELGFLLDKEYGIMTRTGLHCAPLAHKTIGTFPGGTIRFSFGYFNTIEEVNYSLNSLYNILKRS